MKRAKYFITCNGVFAEGILFDPVNIYKELIRSAQQRRRRKGVLDGQLTFIEESAQQPGWDAPPLLPDETPQPVKKKPLLLENSSRTVKTLPEFSQESSRAALIA